MLKFNKENMRPPLIPSNRGHSGINNPYEDAKIKDSGTKGGAKEKATPEKNKNSEKKGGN